MVLVLVVLVASVVLINGVGRDGDGGGGGAGGVGDVDVGRDGDGGGAGAGVVAILAQAFWSQLHVLLVFSVYYQILLGCADPKKRPFPDAGGDVLRRCRGDSLTSLANPWYEAHASGPCQDIPGRTTHTGFSR